ncbi:MAG: mechanosensitive ion channel protein [Betaproteobacteria bacterium]|nr:mechanosensitive ion channel protein [Betaproteobacteria bacterium]
MRTELIFDSGLWLGQTRWTWELLHQPAALLEALLSLAVPIVLALLVVQGSARVLRAAFPDSRAIKRVQRVWSWVIWGGIVLWLTGLLPLLLQEMDEIHWRLGGVKVSLRTMVEGALSLVAVLLVTLWTSAAVERQVLTRLAPSSDPAALSLRKMAVNIIRTGLWVVGVLLALSAAGIPLTALGVFGGALGVGIGLGLQKLAANYVSGFVVLAERSVRIGDMVSVDGFEGRITDIKTRYTVIRALNGRESIVPNEVLLTQRIENSSLADPKVVQRTSVTVAYGTGLSSLSPLMVQAVAAVPRVLSEPPPAVHLDAFGPDGLELIVSFWIEDPENGSGNVKSDVNLALLTVLNGQGVVIPYPQREMRWSGPPPASTP